MRTDEYWQKRSEEVAIRAFKQGDKSLKDLELIFRKASKQVQTEINAFYGKYGKVEETFTYKTLANGSRVASGSTKKVIVPAYEYNKPLAKGTRLTKLQGQINQILMDMSHDQDAYMKSTLKGVATNVYYDTIYDTYKGIGFGSSFSLLNDQILNGIITNEVNGMNFSKRVWNNRTKLQFQVQEILNDGLIRGATNRDMALKLADKMDKGYGVAKRLIDTEVTNTLNQGSKKASIEAGATEEYIYIATLDNRTSDICTALDGEVFKLSEATTGVNYPPMHVNCRSTTAPYFGNLSETRIARNVDTGKTFLVPGNMTIKDFKDIYVDKNVTRSEWDKNNL